MRTAKEEIAPVINRLWPDLAAYSWEKYQQQGPGAVWLELRRKSYPYAGAIDIAYVTLADAPSSEVRTDLDEALKVCDPRTAVVFMLWTRAACIMVVIQAAPGMKTPPEAFAAQAKRNYG